MLFTMAEVEEKRWKNVFRNIEKDCLKPVQEVGKSKKNESGTTVTFMPDAEIFKTTRFKFDVLAERMRELAYLNKTITINIKDLRDGGEEETFHFKGGLVEFVHYLDAARTPLHKTVYVEGEGQHPVEIAFNIQTHTTKIYFRTLTTLTQQKAEPIWWGSKPHLHEHLITTPTKTA
jgi:DNA gyrase/topoisomerase IV subunit B